MPLSVQKGTKTNFVTSCQHGPGGQNVRILGKKRPRSTGSR